MKRNIIVTFGALFSLSIGTGFSQTQVTLQPNSSAGKDAIITTGATSQNYGTHPDFDALAWTNSGQEITFRSLIEFDLSAIPITSSITSATLTLYNNPTSVNTNTIHQSLSGSNAAFFEKVLQPWNENTVTWLNQPNTTVTNQIFLPQSTSGTQTYVLDVTTLIQDAVSNPSTYYGFMLKLQTEIYYRSLIFASSDNANPAIRPKLEINYTSALDLESNNKLNFECFPNPVSDGHFLLNVSTPVDLKVFSIQGKLVFCQSNISGEGIEISTVDWAKGTYFVEVKQNDKIGRQKILVQ